MLSVLVEVCAVCAGGSLCWWKSVLSVLVEVCAGCASGSLCWCNQHALREDACLVV